MLTLDWQIEALIERVWPLATEKGLTAEALAARRTKHLRAARAKVVAATGLNATTTRRVAGGGNASIRTLICLWRFFWPRLRVRRKDGKVFRAGEAPEDSRELMFEDLLGLPVTVPADYVVPAARPPAPPRWWRLPGGQRRGVVILDEIPEVDARSGGEKIDAAWWCTEALRFELSMQLNTTRITRRMMAQTIVEESKVSFSYVTLFRIESGRQPGSIETLLSCYWYFKPRLKRPLSLHDVLTAAPRVSAPRAAVRTADKGEQANVKGGRAAARASAHPGASAEVSAHKTGAATGKAGRRGGAG